MLLEKLWKIIEPYFKEKFFIEQKVRVRTRREVKIETLLKRVEWSNLEVKEVPEKVMNNYF